jgi:hypothetical protein
MKDGVNYRRFMLDGEYARHVVEGGETQLRLRGREATLWALGMVARSAGPESAKYIEASVKGIIEKFIEPCAAHDSDLAEYGYSMLTQLLLISRQSGQLTAYAV